MKSFRYFIFILLLFPLGQSHGQGYVWGPKGGLSMGLQQWENYQREPLFAGHGALYIESLTKDNEFSLYAQAGYHVRGSAIRFTYRSLQGDLIRRADNMSFQNLGLTIGAKQKFDWRPGFKPYYSIGLRGEYNLGTNIEIQIYDQIDEFTNDFLFGATIGGGLEWQFSELIGAFIELNFQPDFTNQVFIPPNPNARNPITNEPQPHREIKIKNVSFELSVGMRFLRKVVYVE